MGTYGFVRLSLPLLPDAAVKAVGWVGLLSIIAIIYGALVSMAQKDMKKLVAYSSVQPHGFHTLACSRSTAPGLPRRDPADDQPRASRPARSSCSSALSYERRHNRMISEYGGIAR